MIRMLFATLLVASAAWGSAGLKFRPLFEQVTRQYWSDTPHTWHLIYELASAESSFRPQVRSPVGAVGLLQVMPATWHEIRTQAIPDLGHVLDDPRDNARAGAYYLRRQYNLWHANRSEENRLKLALASYNAGAGHLIKAQRLAGGATSFEAIAARLPEGTGSHAPGTIAYAHKIVGRYQAQAQAPPVPVPVPLAPAVPPIHVEVHVEGAAAAPAAEPPNDMSTLVMSLFALMQIAWRATKSKEESDG